jgi:hypothetical protein
MKNLNSINWHKREAINWSQRPAIPFPGKHPIRWYAWYEYGLGGKLRTWTYRGKPSKQVAQQITHLLKKYAGNFMLVEFDKGGVVSLSRGIGPTNRDISVHDWNSYLYRLYYPLNTMSGYILRHWLGPELVKTRFKHDKHTWGCYLETNMKADRLLKDPTMIKVLEDHKKWLINNKQHLWT